MIDLAIDVEKLADLSKTLKDNAGTIRTYNEEIYSLVYALNEGWSGEAYDAFKEQFETHRAELESLPILFESFGAKIEEFDLEGEALIEKVKNALNKMFSYSTSTYVSSGEYSAWKYENRYSNGKYRMDEDYEKARDARDQGEEIRKNLKSDLKLLETEKENILVNINALKNNKDKFPDDVYESLLASLVEKSEVLDEAIGKYNKAIDVADGLLEDKLFTGWGSDGALVEASDWFNFWDGKNDKTDGAIKDFNKALDGLPPVSALVEGASVNDWGDMVDSVISDTDYLKENKSFMSGVNQTAMMGAYIAASNGEANETKKVTSNGRDVVLFNSRAFLSSGKINEDGTLAAENSGLEVNNQFDAYGILGTKNYDGYDSVVFVDEKTGEQVYMTYTQYSELYGNIIEDKEEGY